MTGKLVRCWRSAFQFSAAFVFLGGLCTACARSFTLPDGCEANAAPATPAALKACLTALDFSTLEAAGDDQVLTVVEKNGQGSPCPGTQDRTRTCRYGPRAVIQSEVNSYKVKYSDLQKGRIIARLFIPKGEAQDYDSLKLAPGRMTYWWVQVTVSKKKFESAHPGDSAYATAGGAQQQNRHVPKDVYGTSVFLSDSAGQIVKKERPLYYRRHPDQFKQALARWVWDPDDETAQGSCSKGCCR